MTEQEAVTAANQAFYRAFESLDIAQMQPVWDDDAEVSCVHPGWPLIAGRGEVLQSWATIFRNTMVMQFTVTESAVHVEGEWAWVVCTETLRSVVNAQVTEARVEAVNIYRLRDGRWRLVHHHGGPVM